MHADPGEPCCGLAQDGCSWSRFERFGISEQLKVSRGGPGSHEDEWNGIMPNLKWWKFNANDWLADSRLQLVGLAEKGLLIHMLCLMHQSENRGVLETNGVPWSVEEIAHSCHERVQKVRKLCSTLVQKGIISCSESGAFYSKRMVEDTTQIQRQSEFGKMGGNPTLKGSLKGGLKGTLKPRYKNKEVRIKNTEEHTTYVPPLPPQESEADDRPVEADGSGGSHAANVDPLSEHGPIPFPTPEELQAVVDVWNSSRSTNRVKFLTEPRRRQLITRLRDKIFASHWREAIEKISASEFFANGWKPGFDWFLDPENLLKVLEGNYDHKARAGPSGAKHAGQDLFAGLRQFVAEGESHESQ